MFNNFTSYLMPHNTRTNKWNFTFHNMKIRVADSTGLGLDEKLSSLGTWHVKVFNGERLVGFPIHSSTHVLRQSQSSNKPRIRIPQIPTNTITASKPRPPPSI
jgi:hypothetical protein